MSKKTAMEEFARDAGLRFDKEVEMIFGYKGGHNFCITLIENSYRMLIAVSVTNNGENPSESTIKEFTGQNSNISGYKIDGRRIVFETAGAMGIKKCFDKGSAALNEIAAFLTKSGYKDCCQECGVENGINAYYINGNGNNLCATCFTEIKNSMEQNKQGIKTKKGSILTGTVGALIGSLLGVASIVIIGQLGYVAALSGIIMAVCTLKGYELLGGKLDTIGIIISSVIMLVMVYVGNNLDWAIVIVQSIEGVSIFEAFSFVNALLSEGVIAFDDYFINLFSVYAFVILGAFPTIKNAAKVKSGSYVARRAE